MNGSVWNDITLPRFPDLKSNLQCDILIVGGGLCGLLCAYELIESGVTAEDIVLIDSSRIFSGASVNATAKLTSQHGMIYSHLVRSFGSEFARRYAAANQTAVKRAFEISDRLGERDAVTSRTAYIYSQSGIGRDLIEKEQAAASASGINCDITDTCELPFDITGALYFGNQAAFHPSEFARALLKYLDEKGCNIYENTTALDIKKDAVITDKGKIFAKKTVISSHFPFADKRGLYFIKLYQQRAHLLAVEGAPPLKGMYVGAEKNSLTFRQAGDRLLFGGYPCKEGDSYRCFFDLIGTASEIFPGCSVVRRWTNEDVMTHDRVPYIGSNSHLPGTYIATGFGMWGMSTSFVAGKLISDLIVHGYSEYSDIFSPDRNIIRAGKRSFFINAAETASEFISPSKASLYSADLLAKGTGHISVFEGHKVGAYKDADGRTHLVAPRCSHMKCALRWNRAEQTWDCPCHGSRFDTDGNVIAGPAVRSIRFYSKSKNS